MLILKWWAESCSVQCVYIIHVLHMACTCTCMHQRMHEIILLWLLWKCLFGLCLYLVGVYLHVYTSWWLCGNMPVLCKSVGVLHHYFVGLPDCVTVLAYGL